MAGRLVGIFGNFTNGGLHFVHSDRNLVCFILLLVGEAINLRHGLFVNLISGIAHMRNNTAEVGHKRIEAFCKFMLT